MTVDVGHQGQVRDRQRQWLPTEISNLFEAAVANNVKRFKEALESPEAQTLLLDPDQGVENNVWHNGDTLVHTMAENSAACLDIFLDFVENNWLDPSKETQITKILSNIPTVVVSIIHDYAGKFNYICFAGLDKPNDCQEIPFIKAVYGIHIASVKLFLKCPATPAMHILQQAYSQIEDYQLLIEKTLNFLENTNKVATRVREGVERNPHSKDPLLELRHILDAAISISSNTTVVGNTPLVVNYFMR